MPNFQGAVGRRLILGGAGAASLAAMLPGRSARAAQTVTLPLLGGPDERP